jgi:hypothetical protein
VHGFGYSLTDQPGGVEDPYKRARYEAQHRRILALGERLDFTVTPIETNVLCLHPDTEPYYRIAFSGGFLAPLAAASSYVSDALIASAGKGGIPDPHGSHPMLDPLYSTGAVRMHHAQPQLTRLDKIALIADWEPAFDTLRVCFGQKISDPEMPNCGICEKCVRTMLGLIVWDALPRFTTFPLDDVSPEMIAAVRIRPDYVYLGMPDLLAGLDRVGREDLIHAIRSRLERLNETRWDRLRRKWRGS